MKKTILTLLTTCFWLTLFANDPLLTGTPIGSPANDNPVKNAFDKDLNTYYASNSDRRSYVWVGLDLGKQYVITRAGWSPRNDGVGPERVVLGMIEGANRSDFLDAVPLYIIDK